MNLDSQFSGRGLKVRTRLYMVSPQQQTSAECNEQLMEKSECEGARPDCEFSAEDARLICGMKKEVIHIRSDVVTHRLFCQIGNSHTLKIKVSQASTCGYELCSKSTENCSLFVILFFVTY